MQQLGLICIVWLFYHVRRMCGIVTQWVTIVFGWHNVAKLWHSRSISRAEPDASKMQAASWLCTQNAFDYQENA